MAYVMGYDATQPDLSSAPGDGALNPRRAAFALLLLLPAPTIGVLCAMHWMPDTAIGKSVHLGAKIWLLALPLVWLLWVDRGRLQIPKWHWRGMGAGLVTGLLTMGVIMGAWELFAHQMVDIDFFSEKMQEIGLGTPAKYLAFAAGVTFINALLEEYVWRWFVYSKWRVVLDKLFGGSAKAIVIPGAIALAGLFFVLHHSVAMAVYFDWQVNALASLGIFIGHVIWSVMYLRYKNIYAAYVSHIFADIGLFVVGYGIAFG